MSTSERTPLPVVPSDPPPGPSSGPPRRSFLGLIAALTGTLAAALVAVPLVGYLLGALLRRQDAARLWVDAGTLADYPTGETILFRFTNPARQPHDGAAANAGVYIRNQGTGETGAPNLLVLSIYCTHLGCPVTWFASSGLFLCPCHGGVYYETGERASGPPPRGLYHCPWRIENGRLQVQLTHLPTLQHTLAPEGRS